MTTYALAEIPEKLGSIERTSYRIARNGHPEGHTFWQREDAEAMLTGWQRLPEGYHLDYIQTGEGWRFRASKHGLKSSPSADIEKVIAWVAEHVDTVQRRAATRTATATRPV